MNPLHLIFRREERAGEESWRELLSRVADAVLGLLAAEARGLGDDLEESWRRARGALVWIAVFAGLALCLVLLLLTAAVAGLAEVVPVWAAALIVAALLGFGAWWSAKRARENAGRVENPTRIVSRRVADHLSWWRAELESMQQSDGWEDPSEDATGGEPWPEAPAPTAGPAGAAQAFPGGGRAGDTADPEGGEGADR